MRDQLRQRLRDADVQNGRRGRQPVAHDLREFAAQREDLLGVSVHQMPCFREHQPPTDALEQRLTDRLFQQAKLAADRLRREVQQFAGAGDPAVFRDGIEVLQVPVVEVSQVTQAQWRFAVRLAAPVGLSRRSPAECLERRAFAQ